MILLSKKEILRNFGLLYSFLSFWNISANAFCLSLGMISPMLFDVATIVVLPVDGDEMLYLHDAFGTDLGFQVNKKNNAYFTFINTFNMVSGLIGETKHKAFLLFWICRFFISTSSIVIVAKFTSYVLPILSQSYLNIPNAKRRIDQIGVWAILVFAALDPIIFPRISCRSHPHTHNTIGRVW